MKTRLISFAILLTVAMAGCGPSQAIIEDSPARPEEDPQLRESPSQAPSSNSGETPIQFVSTPEASDMKTSTPPDKNKLVDLAKQDLADRLKIDLGQIDLLKTMEITWPDISAGCSPSSGQILTKGRVYGYRVWLEANGDEYIYHVGETGQVILCPKVNPGANNPLLMTPGSPTQDPYNQEP